jgi:hypothetical protein
MKPFLISLCVLFVISAQAQIKYICPYDPIPSGWVKTGESRCSCCGKGQTQYKIQFIGNYSPTADVSMCSNQPIPSGWIKVAQYNSSNCGSGISAMIITKIEGLPAGYEEYMCGDQPVPQGWVKVNQTSCTTCGPNTKIFIKIKKVDLYPTGTLIDMCSEQAIPTGWIKTTDYACTCCNTNLRVGITKYLGMAVGKTISVCGDQAIPSGWSKVKEYPCTCCGTSKKKMDIKRISGVRIGVDEELAATTGELLLYPNPSNQLLNVAVKAFEKPQSYAITDLTGRSIIAHKLTGADSLGNFTIDTSKLPLGTYILQVIGPNAVVSGKFKVE